MPGIRASSSALAVVACASALAACGGDDEGGPIPQEAGEQLIGQLDQIQTLVNDGLCDEAQQTAVSFATGVNDLPEEVGGELRDRLVEASGNLESLTTDQCTPATGATGETGEVPPETTDEPTPTEETTEPTTTEEEEPPPEEEEDGDEPSNGSSGSGDSGGGNEGGGSIGGDEGSGGIGSDG